MVQKREFHQTNLFLLIMRTVQSITQKNFKRELLLEVKANPLQLLSKLADMNFLNDYTTWINGLNFYQRKDLKNLNL